MFHTVLQYTYRPQEPDRPRIRRCVYKRHRLDSNGCLNPSFSNIKMLPRLLFQCATLATPPWEPVRYTAGIG